LHVERTERIIFDEHNLFFGAKVEPPSVDVHGKVVLLKWYSVDGFGLFLLLRAFVTR
jgi:hypothetical protein